MSPLVDAEFKGRFAPGHDANASCDGGLTPTEDHSKL